MNVDDTHVNSLLDMLPQALNNIITLDFISLKSYFVFNERQTNLNGKYVNDLFDILPQASNNIITSAFMALKYDFVFNQRKKIE